MQNFKLKIPSVENENDLTIVYIEGNVTTHEIKARKSKFLKTLRYFQKKSTEINQTRVVYIQEDIPFDIFSDFITSIKKKEVDINEHNCEQYYYLSCKYEYTELKTEIEQFIQARPDINLLINQLFASNSISKKIDNIQSSENSMKEEIIASNLDISIQNGNLKKLPLDMLNRILNSPKKVIKNHHSLFEFIISLIKEKMTQKLNDEERENLLLLPSSLDYCQMDNDEIIQLLDIENKNGFFMPKNAGNRMKMLIEIEEKQKEENSMLRGEIKNNEKKCITQINEISASIQQTETKLLKIIQTQGEELTKTKNQLDLHIKEAKELQKKQEEQLGNIENKFQMKIKEIEQRLIEIETRVSKIVKTQEENLEKNKKQPTVIEEEKIQKQKEDEKNIREFQHQNGIEFQGIMNFLTKQTGGNIHNNKTNSDYVSNDENSQYHPKTLVDYAKTEDIYYDSANKDAIICFDFKNKKVQLSSYTIKSHQNMPGDGISTETYSGHLRNWVIEVSNDKQHWETVDRRVNDGTLNGSNIIATFDVNQNSHPDNFYRYIQLRQTGYSWYGSDHYDIFFYLIDFYGKLQDV